MADDPNPNPDPNPDQDSPAAAVRPEGIPDNLWTDDKGFNAEAFAAYRAPAEDLPATADAYVLPKIGDKDLPEGIADSPFMKTLREGAHGAGLGQAAFEQLVTGWIAADEAAADAYSEEQAKLIGQNRDTRSAAIATWLDSSLPKEQAEALRNAATSADVFKGLESLMNKGTTTAPRDPMPDPNPGDTLEVIQGLMRTPAYNGRADQRDPAVIARVDKFFEEQARKEAEGKK